MYIEIMDPAIVNMYIEIMESAIEFVIVYKIYNLILKVLHPSSPWLNQYIYLNGQGIEPGSPRLVSQCVTNRPKSLKLPLKFYIYI